MKATNQYFLAAVMLLMLVGIVSLGAVAQTAPSKDEKAAAEALAAERARVAEENRKIAAANEVVSRSFRAGNDALTAGRIDEAIVRYREGLAVRPNEAALLTNLSEALRRRGVQRFNAALKDPNNQATPANKEAAKKDWIEAADSSRKALDVIKSVTPADASNQIHDQNRRAALSTYALAMGLMATKVNRTKARAAWQAYQEYIDVEADTPKKTKLRGEALQLLFDAEDLELAIGESRKVLAADPEDLIATRVLGLALFASGDKTKFQEAAKYLQRYVTRAPDTDPLKKPAMDSLEYLRTQENIKPQRE
jgi:tetratricopeptide (TPR) repeat protein